MATRPLVAYRSKDVLQLKCTPRLSIGADMTHEMESRDSDEETQIVEESIPAQHTSNSLGDAGTTGFCLDDTEDLYGLSPQGRKSLEKMRLVSYSGGDKPLVPQVPAASANAGSMSRSQAETGQNPKQRIVTLRVTRQSLRDCNKQIDSSDELHAENECNMPVGSHPKSNKRSAKPKRETKRQSKPRRAKALTRHKASQKDMLQKNEPDSCIMKKAFPVSKRLDEQTKSKDCGQPQPTSQIDSRPARSKFALIVGHHDQPLGVSQSYTQDKIVKPAATSLLLEDKRSVGRDQAIRDLSDAGECIPQTNDPSTMAQTKGKTGSTFNLKRRADIFTTPRNNADSSNENADDATLVDAMVQKPRKRLQYEISYSQSGDLDEDVTQREGLTPRCGSTSAIPDSDLRGAANGNSSCHQDSTIQSTPDRTTRDRQTTQHEQNNSSHSSPTQRLLKELQVGQQSLKNAFEVGLKEMKEIIDAQDQRQKSRDEALQTMIIKHKQALAEFAGVLANS